MIPDVLYELPVFCGHVLFYKTHYVRFSNTKAANQALPIRLVAEIQCHAQDIFL